MSTFLPKSRKSIYTRIFIPKEQQGYFKERLEIRKSLHTEDHDEAT